MLMNFDSWAPCVKTSYLYVEICPARDGYPGGNGSWPAAKLVLVSNINVVEAQDRMYFPAGIAKLQLVV